MVKHIQTIRRQLARNCLSVFDHFVESVLKGLTIPSQIFKVLWHPFYQHYNISSRTEVFLEKGILKICSKFTREHPCRRMISIKSQNNFIEITLRHGCSPVNLLNIFRTHFTKNTSWRLLLKTMKEVCQNFDIVNILNGNLRQSNNTDAKNIINVKTLKKVKGFLSNLSIYIECLW